MNLPGMGADEPGTGGGRPVARRVGRGGDGPDQRGGSRRPRRISCRSARTESNESVGSFPPSRSWLDSGLRRGRMSANPPAKVRSWRASSLAAALATFGRPRHRPRRHGRRLRGGADLAQSPGGPQDPAGVSPTILASSSGSWSRPRRPPVCTTPISFRSTWSASENGQPIFTRCSSSKGGRWPSSSRVSARGDAWTPDDDPPAATAILPPFRRRAGPAGRLGAPFAHEQGIIHRDIKPSNLLIDGSGWLWVADFGLARIAGEARPDLSGAVLGTLRYMSPEQVLGTRGGRRSPHRHLLAGGHPLRAAHPAARVRR